MGSWQEEPQVGQTIWTQDRGNGIIRAIDWDNGRRIYADFYDKGKEQFDWDDLVGNFDEKLNQWVIIPI